MIQKEIGWCNKCKKTSKVLMDILPYTKKYNYKWRCLNCDDQTCLLCDRTIDDNYYDAQISICRDCE